MKAEYKKVGLKVGLEIHQQLDTKHKLFCKCPTTMREKYPIFIVERKQHPVLSELGEIDAAAQYEYLRDRRFFYQVFKNESCLVELDEEPPHELNREALEIALQIALLLNCDIPDEIHVMRKTVIDGSNTSGFQRTAVVGTNGYIKFKGKKIEIKSVCLEEDAAAKVKEENGNVTYKLNRLGVPLVEISTGIIEGFSPEEIEQIAFHIGMICRSTKRVKEEIGSIRQDLNISIRGSARVEIKGIQELSLISKVIENEIRRQLSLIRIRKEARKRGVKRIKPKIFDVTDLLKETDCKVLRKVIDLGGRIFAFKLNKLSGMLKEELFPGKTLGRELADFVSCFGVKGIIHSDEDLSRYKLEEDFKVIKKKVGARKEDCVILIGEFNEKPKVTTLLIEKINRILEKNEEETRTAEQDGKTRFMRPLPGAARMYPESDIPPIPLSKEYIKQIKKSLPELWTKKYKRFLKKYKLSQDLAMQVLLSPYSDFFEEVVKKYKIAPTLVATTLTSLLKELRREGRDIKRLNESHFSQIFELLSKKKIVKEAIPEILRYLCDYPKSNAVEAVEELDLQPLSKEEVKKVVEDVLNMRIAPEKVFGVVMSRVRGRVSAEEVKKIVDKLMKKRSF